MFVIISVSLLNSLQQTQQLSHYVCVVFFYIYFFAWYNSSYCEKGGVEGVEAEEVVEISLDSTLF